MDQYSYPRMNVPCRCPNCRAAALPRIKSAYVAVVEILVAALQSGDASSKELQAANRMSNNVECPFTIQVS